MTIKIEKPQFNIRETLRERDIPVGGHGSQVMQSESLKETFNITKGGRRNLLVNGSFSVWQRGNTFSSGYTADQWKVELSGASITTTSREFGVGQKEVPGNSRYYLRYDVTTGADFSRLMQRMENVRNFDNVPITVSGWCKRSSGKATECRIDLIYNYGGGGSSGEYDYDVAAFWPSGRWEYFEYTFNTRSMVGKTINDVDSSLEIRFGQGSNTSSHAYQWNFANIQVEYGRGATPFEERPLSEEIALCQRYCQRFPFPEPPVSAFGTGCGNGNQLQLHHGSGGGRVSLNISSIPMRKTPTVTVYDGSGNQNSVAEFSSGTTRTVSAIYPAGPNIGGYAQLTANANNPVYMNVLANAEL